MSWDAGKRADMGKWNDLAAKELRDKPVDDLVWRSAEGIEIKPVYTAEDLENLEYVDSTPGFAPFIR
ncbi:MAG: methylmalonyl-CoA mutase family protein, partial [Myxococcales bacterium]